MLDEIESAIFQAAASILAGQGFSYRYFKEGAIGLDYCHVIGMVQLSGQCCAFLWCGYAMHQRVF